MNEETLNDRKTSWFAIIDAVANHLISEDIPNKEDPSYNNKLVTIETKFNEEIKKLNNSIKEVRIVSHEKTVELERGSESGDFLVLDVKIKNDLLPHIVRIRLTNIAERLVNEIKEKEEKAKHQKEFDELTNAYMNSTWGTSDIESLKTPNVKAVYEAMIKEIDKLYCIGFHMPESKFYQTQIDLLIGKMRTLENMKEEEFEFPKETVLKNNATLLKYFLIQYLRTIYKEEFGVLAQWRV